MGVAEIVGFAVCWLVVASLMLWGVFTEHKRGPVSPAVSPQTPRKDGTADWHPSRLRVSPSDWIVVESAAGGSPEIQEQARYLANAWLASRGVDAITLPPGDLRIEVTVDGEGAASTRVLVRAAALHTSRRRR
jgi:hypothetical protein